MLFSACAIIGIGTAVGTTATVAHDRRTTGTFIEDSAIELKIIKRLYRNEEIKKSSHINVTSYNTIVLITGETPIEENRNRIVNIVRDTPKVTRVYDELTIAAPSSWISRSSDSLITTKIKVKLFNLKGFDATRIKVVTEKGVAYLMGILTKAESDEATEKARQTDGVQKVVKIFQYID